MIDPARLAPDAASLGAAQRVAVKHLWPVAAMSARAVWGEHLGSSRYEVAIDLSDAASRCTCPSRKVPCKHVLALLLLAADGLPQAGEPAAIAAWLDKRAAVRLTKEAAPIKDAEAQVARKEARVEKVDLGIARLDRFFEDVVRQGLGALDGHAGAELIANEVRRLIDAQAGGLAARLSGVAARIGVGGDWAGIALDRLGRLALLSEAWQRRDGLSAALQADLRALIGFSTTEEEVRAHGDVVRDTWFVMSDTVELVEQLRHGRTWLCGKTSGRDALQLRFAPGNAPFGDTWTPGSEVAATLAFYPSAWPQRALVLEKAPPLIGPAMPRVVSIATLLETWSEALARQPWLERMPAALGPVEVTGERVFDATGSLPLVVYDVTDLLAVAGGRPLTLAGEWTGERFVALSAQQDGWYSSLTNVPPAVPIVAEATSRFAAVAVLGTARRPLREDELDPELVAIDGPLERRVLLAAGCEGIRRAAGRAAGAIPERLDAAPPEVRPALPDKLAQRVAALLGDTQLAPEVVRAIDRKGLRLPPDLLSRALPFVRTRPELLGVLGERGRWLAGLGLAPAVSAAFARAAPDDPARVFAEGTLEQRREALRALRKGERERARVLVAATWREEKPDVRVALLEVLQEDLREDDRALLESLQNDRSQLVRRKVRAALGHIVGTDVYLRQRARIAALCAPPRLDLPIVSDDSWAEDGIEGLAHASLGERAAWLAALAMSAPARLWCEVTGLEPGPLVDALLPSDNVIPWLLGLAWRSLDAAFATAVSFGIPSIEWPDSLYHLRDGAAEFLLAQVPEPTRDRLQARWFTAFPRASFSSWGPELSRAIIRGVEQTGDYARVNDTFAIQLHPSLLQLALDVPAVRRAYRIAALLELRLRFHQELNLAVRNP